MLSDGAPGRLGERTVLLYDSVLRSSALVYMRTARADFQRRKLTSYYVLPRVVATSSYVT